VISAFNDRLFATSFAIAIFALTICHSLGLSLLTQNPCVSQILSSVVFLVPLTCTGLTWYWRLFGLVFSLHIFWFCERLSTLNLYRIVSYRIT